MHGEDRCPNNDGLQEIHGIIRDVNAVIITTPVYALQVTALVKIAKTTKLIQIVIFINGTPLKIIYIELVE